MKKVNVYMRGAIRECYELNGRFFPVSEWSFHGWQAIPVAFGAK